VTKPVPLPGDLEAQVERQRAEIDELRAWVRQYRHFAQQSSNVIFMLDLETGCLVYVNDRFEDLLGYSRAELMAPGFDFFVMIDPDSEEKVRRSYSIMEGLGGSVSLESPGRDRGAVATITLPVS